MNSIRKMLIKCAGVRMTCIFLAAVVLGGCTPRNVTKGMEQGEAYDAVISVKGKQEKTQEMLSDRVASDSKQLLELAGLLGRTDEEVAGLLGGGTENRTEDGELLVGRDYETEFFGKSCSVHTSYDDAGTVWLALAEPQDADADEVRERIEAVTGNKPKETLEEDDADFSKTLEWNWEGIGISLYESEGGISISLSLAQE